MENVGFLALNLYSLVVLIILIIIFFAKERMHELEDDTYAKLLVAGGITIFFGLLLGITPNFKIDVKYLKIIIEIFNKIYLSGLVITISIFAYYTYCITYLKSKSINFVNKFYKIFCLVNSAIIFLLPLNVDNIDLVNSGIAMYYTYTIFALVYLILFVMVLFNIRKIKNKKYIPVIALILEGGLMTLIQIFNPELNYIVNPGMVLVFLIMYFTIENPDVKMIEQLELAKDSADKANAAKTDFLSSMSHEIRTPLNAIVGFSDCIKHADNLDEAKENADDIIDASNTLLEIVNGILDISKIEAGKLEIVNSDYNARDLFSGLAKLVTPKMSEKGLDFQVTIAEDLPATLYGDPANIKKVVTNLLSNAYKYTDKGFVKYDVKCVNNEGVCRLIISVEDSGRGIKKENVEKLFTKFQRVDEDKNTTIEGTGLGLAITKQLIELMGGSVVVTTEYGEGSKFIITLDQRIDNVVVSNSHNETSGTLDLTDKKLLIVDDNPLNLKVATKLFERYNAIIDTCDSGFKCLTKITNGETYDLILMDDMMPKMSGTETLHKLQESSSFNIPVIALTANAITGMKEKYLSEGFNDYLAKPIDKDEMISVLNNIFNTNGIDVKNIVPVVEEINNNTDFLEANGIDVKAGLDLLGDILMYNETMGMFLDEVDNRLAMLYEYKENSDMANYAILVHAIKSDCKYLGITELADLSYEHELKSKDKDVEYVNSNFDNYISLVEDYVTICKSYLDRD